MSEVLNGGMIIKLDDYELKQISDYSPSWDFEEGDSFENWDFTTIHHDKGRRFMLSVTAKNLTIAKKDELLKVLYKRDINLECLDYIGAVRVTSLGLPVTSCNFFGTFYNVSFSVAAVGLTGSGGGL